MTDPSENESVLKQASQALQRGAHRAAEKHYRQILDSDPMHAIANQGLAIIHHARGEYSQVEACLRRVLAARPGDAAAHNNLGIILQTQGRFNAALECFQKALAQRPGFAQAHCNVGKIFQIWGELDKAKSRFNEALRHSPAHPEALAALAVNHELRGEYEKGLELIRPLVNSGARSAELVVTYGNLERRLGNGRAALPIAEQAMTTPDSPTGRMHLHFLLGDLHDDLGNYDQAFTNYQAGNRMRQASFDQQQHIDSIDALIAAFDAQTSASLCEAEPARPTPVFIVGMPRTGTSLLEQILAGHPGVHALGEQLTLGAIVSKLSTGAAAESRYPLGVARLGTGDIEPRVKEYLERCGAFPAEATHFTDKMPANFLHLGLIQMLFPNARILHCLRDPLDTALSCYFQNFSALGLAFSFDLGDIALYYRQYERLMNHWRSVLKMAIMDVRYEELIADTGGTTRRVCDYLGLAWRAELLEFPRLERPVPTASHAQVRKGIYDSSVRRWQRYDRYLGQLKENLGLRDG